MCVCHQVVCLFACFFNTRCKATCWHLWDKPFWVSSSPLSTLQITLLLQKSSIVQSELISAGNFLFLTSFSLLSPLKQNLLSPFTDTQGKKCTRVSSASSCYSTSFCKAHGAGLLLRNAEMIFSLTDDTAVRPVTKPHL